MEICNNIHRLKITFQVTETINRDVYIYILFGKKIYLVDAGVVGSVNEIAEYLTGHGRNISELGAVFLTHTHPDHIGGLSEIKDIAPSCIIYGPKTEQVWVENIDEQFRQRPIPNFYKLIGKSVKLDKALLPNEKIEIEDGLVLKTIDSKGHSHGSISYMLNQKILFTGDSIPAKDDMPIFTSLADSIKTLRDIMEITGIEIVLSAWEDVLINKRINEYIQNALDTLLKIKEAVLEVCSNYHDATLDEKIGMVCIKLNMETLKNNPLFQHSITLAIEETIFENDIYKIKW